MLDEGSVDVFCGLYSVVRGKVREEGERGRLEGILGNEFAGR